MQKIRGIKVEPDSAADDAKSNDADSSPSKSPPIEESRIMPESDANRPHVDNKTGPKKHSKKSVAGGDAVAGGSTTVIPSVCVPADQQSSQPPVVSVPLGGDVNPITLAETSSSTSLSLSTHTSTDSLRTCAHCQKQESTLHEFKKCKK